MEKESSKAIDKNELTAQARQTGATLIKTLESFGNENFNQHPPQSGWSAGQVAEHLLKSSGIVEVIAGKTEPSKRPADQMVAPIAGIFLDFTTKLPSPDFIIPEEKHYDQQEMITRLKAVWEKIIEAIHVLDLSALCLDFEFPGTGPLTRLEWISFYIVHTQRHLRQLDRLLAQEPANLRLPLPGR